MSYRFLPPLFDFFFGRGTFDIDLILGFTATRISLLIGSLLHVHRVIMSFYGHHEPGRLRTQSSNVANDFFLVIWRVAFSWSSTLVGIPLQSQWTRWRLFFLGGGDGFAISTKSVVGRIESFGSVGRAAGLELCFGRSKLHKRRQTSVRPSLTFTRCERRARQLCVNGVSDHQD